MRTLGLVALLLLTAAVSEGQTVINAVTDAASYAPRVAPGSLATIFGSNLASSTAQASGFPLPQTLGGAAVFINTLQAPLVYASPTQINFQVPSNLTPGTSTLYVTVSGGNSLPFNFTVTSAAPGIFQDTSNHAVAQNASANYSVNTTKNPAASGSVVVVYLTGLGAVSNPVPDGTATPASPLATATASVSATIGGSNAPVQFLGLTPEFAGLAQANIQVPSLPNGDYPLVITVGGYQGASAVISVSGSGTTPPSFLTLIGQVSFPNSLTNSVAFFGNTTYVCSLNRISIINTGNASKPAYLGEFGDADLAGNGGKCLVNTVTSRPILVDIVGPGSAPTFVVYDISSPTQPVKVGQISPPQYNQFADLTFIGTTGFSSTSWFQFDGEKDLTAQFGDFLSFDFSALLPQLISAMPVNLSLPGATNLNVRPNALALPPSFELVYVASTTATGNSNVGNAALDVIDVSSVMNMQPVDRVVATGSAIFLGLSYDNTLLLLTGNTSGFRNPGVPDFNLTGNLTVTTMNISNVRFPVSPTTVVATLQTTGTYQVQPFGSKIFAIVNNPPATAPLGPGNLMMVDARSSTPLLYPVATQFGLSGIISVNGFLLAPTVNGLNIYQFKIP